MARITATRKARRQRAIMMACGAMSLVVLLAAGGTWAVTSLISSNVSRVNAGTAGTPPTGPLNILMAGVDRRNGLTPEQETRLHVGHDVSSNSDTLMIIHVPADHSSVSVVSLPRDSWVNIPGHGMNKINAAFGLGGPKLMVRTVEEDTGLTINDYAEVDFLGFVKVIDALGGVNICLPTAVNDSYSGLDLSQGIHHVDGVTALEFARDRHSFALSDIARIGDQQQLLSTIMHEAISSGTLANPVRLTRFLHAALAAIRVDKNLNVTELANELRTVPPSKVTFTTVPVANLNYTTPTGQSAILWNTTAADHLFASIKADKALVKKKAPARKKPRPSLKPGQVHLDIYNGTLIPGLSAGTGTQLAATGFSVHRAGLTWSIHDIAQTVIDYPPGRAAAAKLVRKALPGATLHQVKGLSRVRVILGASAHTVSPLPSASPSPPASNAGPGSTVSRTAAQDACR
jgi:LCP family protein required for cell wall assembly